MEVLVLAPFKTKHMMQIRYAAGEGAKVVQMDYDRSKFVQTEVEKALETADVVIGEPEPRLLKADIPLKWIQMTWSGADIYTSRKRFPEGVRVTNAAGAYGHTMSQYVIGQILSITQNLALYRNQQLTQRWESAGPTMSLEGAKVLIFGAGDVGSHVAKQLRGFDVGRIVGVCRDISKPREYFDDLVLLSQAEMHLTNSDIIVCCMPSNDATVHYLNSRRFERINKGAVLVNVGRGDFIDPDALYRALGDGTLRGAALDVTEPEPLPLKHQLWRHPRCIVTPHIAGRSFGHSDVTEDRICAICCDNLKRYVAGEPLANQVI